MTDDLHILDFLERRGSKAHWEKDLRKAAGGLRFFFRPDSIDLLVGGED